MIPSPPLSSVPSSTAALSDPTLTTLLQWQGYPPDVIRCTTPLSRLNLDFMLRTVAMSVDVTYLAVYIHLYQPLSPLHWGEQP